MNILNTDLAILTSIPQDTLDKLTEKSIWCIGHDFYESILGNQNISEIDIGIGKLIISDEEDSIKYKFIPSDNLEKTLLDISLTHKEPLQVILEKWLCSKITNTYKDIF